MIIFIYGEETFLSRRTLTLVKDKFLRAVNSKGLDSVELEGKDLDVNKLNDFFSTNSLFSRKRLVVIENFFNSGQESSYKNMLDYLRICAEKEDGNVLIFYDTVGSQVKLSAIRKELFDFLSSQKYSQAEAKKKNGKDLRDWAQKEILKKGCQIQPLALNFLVNLVGNDLWKLNNEIEKLIAFKSGALITQEDVKLFSSLKIEENIFAFVDAVSEQNKSLALKLFENELDLGIGEIQILAMLERQFKFLIRAREAFERNENPANLASEFKIPAFLAQKIFQKSRAFSLEKLKKYFSQLVEIDFKMKTGQGNGIKLIEVWIASI